MFKQNKVLPSYGVSLSKVGTWLIGSQTRLYVCLLKLLSLKLQNNNLDICLTSFDLSVQDNLSF